jgi:prepilin-type N-terminal cleavage/methylation domain-containing protein
MKKQLGFTLFELLIVMAIIGIAAALFASSLGSNGQRSVREAQTQFATSLSRVRTLVQRYNVSYELGIASDKKSYTLTPKNGLNAVVANVPVISGKFVNGVTLEVLASAVIPSTVYTAPFGRFGGGGAPLCFELVGGQNYRGVISLVGVTGKIVSRALRVSTTSGCN